MRALKVVVTLAVIGAGAGVVAGCNVGDDITTRPPERPDTGNGDDVGDPGADEPDAGESDVSTPPACDPEQCESGECGDDGRCAASGCNDGVQNGDETDVDCGGSCGPCETGQACRVAADCGEDSITPWSECANFADACIETGGTQERTSYFPRCTAAGVCETITTNESRECERETTGEVCAESEYPGGWSACGQFDDVCDTTGTRTRTRVDFQCAEAQCGAMDPEVETEACEREVAGNGAECAAASCREIKERQPDARSGLYFIDPAGTGAPFQAYCEMASHGGGWTLLVAPNAGTFGTEHFFYNGTHTQNGPFTFRNTRLEVMDLQRVINLLPFEEIWFENVGEYRYISAEPTTTFRQKKVASTTWEPTPGLTGHECPTLEFGWNHESVDGVYKATMLLGCKTHRPNRPDRAELYGMGLSSMRESSQLRNEATLGRAEYPDRVQDIYNAAVWVR